mmetsp:Transcript_9881/g.19759  ORF Transcript_9881/g.19759 Transcript_9881/m.19759 type:complete len:268 (+) Transcript_9881:197-1000(+)
MFRPCLPKPIQAPPLSSPHCIHKRGLMSEFPAGSLHYPRCKTADPVSSSLSRHGEGSVYHFAHRVVDLMWRSLVHVSTGSSDLVCTIHAHSVDRGGLVLHSQRLDLAYGASVGPQLLVSGPSHSDHDAFVFQHFGKQDRSNAACPNRFLLGIKLIDRPRHVRVHCAIGTLCRPRAQIFRSSKPSGENDCLVIASFECCHGLHVTTSNTRAFHQNIPRFGKLRTLGVVQGMHLRLVGREALELCTGTRQVHQGCGGLCDLTAIKHTTS